jgi:hypothetical protein
MQLNYFTDEFHNLTLKKRQQVGRPHSIICKPVKEWLVVSRLVTSENHLKLPLCTMPLAVASVGTLYI